jgi:thiol-disulfide isomerase/thioredoxin
MRTFLLLGSLILLAGCAPRDEPAAATGPVHTKGAEPAHIAQGGEVALTDYLVPGKFTIFDFTSKYCGPCQAYTQPLALLHAQRNDVAVVKVDINRPGVKGIDWQSPVARQYHLQSIPQFRIYGRDGKLLAEDHIVYDAATNQVTGERPARQMVDEWISNLK